MGASRLLSSITTLIIHCSATPNGQHFNAADIDEWHRRRGFARNPSLINKDYPLEHIGYHYVILPDGKVQRGRPDNEVGAHVQGHNENSLGICVIGTDEYSRAQWVALKGLVNDLQAEYPKITKVVGHRDLSPDKNGDGKVTTNEWLKTCPGFYVVGWLASGMIAPEDHIFIGPIKPSPTQADSSVLTPPADNAETKPWWQSKTILAAIMAALPSLAHLAGIDYNLIAPYAADIATITAAVLAIIGRKVATKGIG